MHQLTIEIGIRDIKTRSACWDGFGVTAPAFVRSRMGARARVGLAAWGAGRVRYQGRLPPD